MLPLSTFPRPPLPPPSPNGTPLAALLAAKARQMAGPPAGPPVGGGARPEGVLSVAIDQLRHYMTIEPDAEDKAVVATCLANLQKVLAKDQKERHAALGVTPAHKALASGA